MEFLISITLWKVFFVEMCQIFDNSVLQDIKESFAHVDWQEKCTEFHMFHYEIPKLFSGLYTFSLYNTPDGLMNYWFNNLKYLASGFHETFFWQYWVVKHLVSWIWANQQRKSYFKQYHLCSFKIICGLHFLLPYIAIQKK